MQRGINNISLTLDFLLESFSGDLQLSKSQIQQCFFGPSLYCCNPTIEGKYILEKEWRQ